MKRIPFLIVILVIGFFSSPLFSQEEATESNSVSLNALKISPVQFGKSYFELGFELGLKNQKSSIQISPMVLLKRRNPNDQFKGLQTEIQYRNYIKRIPLGSSQSKIVSDVDFYSGAYALGLTYQEDYIFYDYDPETQMEMITEEERKIKAAEAGVFIGTRITFGKKVILDLLAGGGVRYSEIDDTQENSYFYYGDVFDIGYYGIKPRLNLQLGIIL